MKTVEVTLEKVEFMPSEENRKPNVLYYSERFNGLGHLCLCGCGGWCFVPIKEGEWSLDEESITLRPSFGNWAGENPYHAHYVITNGVARFV